MNLWDEILARVETKVNRHSFYTWFKPTTFVAEDTVAVTVRVPNPLFKDWLTKHYAGVITEAMGELKKAGLQVNFVSDSSGDAPADSAERRGSRGARGGRATGSRGAGTGGTQSALHLRHVHRRILESVCARGLSRAWAKRRHGPTIRSSFTAGSVSEKPT